MHRRIFDWLGLFASEVSPTCSRLLSWGRMHIYLHDTLETHHKKKDRNIDPKKQRPCSKDYDRQMRSFEESPYYSSGGSRIGYMNGLWTASHT